MPKRYQFGMKPQYDWKKKEIALSTSVLKTIMSVLHFTLEVNDESYMRDWQDHFIHSPSHKITTRWFYEGFQPITVTMLVAKPFEAQILVDIGRDLSVHALSQWETTLQCNIVSHWLIGHIHKIIPARVMAWCLTNPKHYLTNADSLSTGALRTNFIENWIQEIVA